MKLKLHIPAKEDQGQEGIVLLESAPQIRTVLVRGNKNSIRLPFPYMLFTIKYNIIDGKYVYKGQPRLGLYVNICNSPINSISDLVWACPLETTAFKGRCCTDHQYDNSKFNTLKELADFVISVFYGLRHTVHEPHAFLDFEKITDVDWEEAIRYKSFTYSKVLERIYKKRLSSPFPFNDNLFIKDYPEGIELIDEEWK